MQIQERKKENKNRIGKRRFHTSNKFFFLAIARGGQAELFRNRSRQLAYLQKGSKKGGNARDPAKLSAMECPASMVALISPRRIFSFPLRPTPRMSKVSVTGIPAERSDSHSSAKSASRRLLKRTLFSFLPFF